METSIKCRFEEIESKQARLIQLLLSYDKHFASLIQQPPKAPEGLEFTGEYRTPKLDEWFNIAFSNNAGQCRTEGIFTESDKRWILKPLSKPKRWVFEETGEVRMPNNDEFALDGGGGILKQNGNYYNQYSIVKLVEKPE